MTRWRPPSEASTALVTRAGFERLRAELEELWRVRRPEVVKALAAAAAEGDRRENAEYSASNEAAFIVLEHTVPLARKTM